MKNNQPWQGYQWLGGHPCLDFANTLDHRFKAGARDFLADFTALVQWHAAAGLLTGAQAAALRSGAVRYPQKAAAVFQQALDLREAVYALGLWAATGGPPPLEALADFNALVSSSQKWRGLAAGEGRLNWVFPGEGQHLELAYWPVLWQAVELSQSIQWRQVKSCPAPEGCGWLFLDRSKNRSRRWCSMKLCGNNAKVKRHYRKIKKG